MRILIVDDEYLIASSLKVFLEDEGLRADTAASGEEAVAVLANGAHYDICIMDMRLPGMDGNSAIRSIHTICPETRFIVHTGSVNYILPTDLEGMCLCLMPIPSRSVGRM
ncbi:MAG: response regulator [Gammaproteobacteria bacterium]|nr:response regulator [Gammaproteobacteria bacterium]